MLIYVLKIQYWGDEVDTYLCVNLETTTKIIKEYFQDDLESYSKERSEPFELSEFEIYLWDQGIGNWTIHTQRLLEK